MAYAEFNCNKQTCKHLNRIYSTLTKVHVHFALVKKLSWCWQRCTTLIQCSVLMVENNEMETFLGTSLEKWLRPDTKEPNIDTKHSFITHPFCLGLKCRDQTQHWEFVSAPMLYLCIDHPKRENLESHQDARNFPDNVQSVPEHNFCIFQESFEKNLTWQTGLMWTAWEWKLLWNSFSDFMRTARPACRKEKGLNQCI